MTVTVLRPGQEAGGGIVLDDFQVWVSMEAPDKPDDIFRMSESFCIGNGATLNEAIGQSLEALCANVSTLAVTFK